jgi:predicted Zn-dependent peptidase
LRKAKNQMLAGLYRRLKTIEGRANLLGSYEVFQGDYAKAFDEDKRIEAVTVADIRRVAQKYFTSKNRTVATLIPETAEVGQ